MVRWLEINKGKCVLKSKRQEVEELEKEEDNRKRIKKWCNCESFVKNLSLSLSLVTFWVLKAAKSLNMKRNKLLTPCPGLSGHILNVNVKLHLPLSPPHLLKHSVSSHEETVGGLHISNMPANIEINSKPGDIVSHLHHFPLWALREDQDLVVERIQRLPHWLGLLLGNTDPILQEVNFDVGRCNKSKQKN